MTLNFGNEPMLESDHQIKASAGEKGERDQAANEPTARNLAIASRWTIKLVRRRLLRPNDRAMSGIFGEAISDYVDHFSEPSLISKILDSKSFFKPTFALCCWWTLNLPANKQRVDPIEGLDFGSATVLGSSWFLVLCIRLLPRRAPGAEGSRSMAVTVPAQWRVGRPSFPSFPHVGIGFAPFPEHRHSLTFASTSE